MSKIVQLSEKISNMIAAGEVVENPASVVKELVENSIDANAKKIEINLKNSGINLIEIIDDGEGMSKDDSLMCFKRHATSKIKTKQDLFRISSLGFRGEAIPSIASVSIFTLQTKTKESDGHMVVYKGGKLIKQETYHMNNGTHIKVDSLFYNTPARLNYLKSEQAELGYIVDLIDKYAIANKNISFTLTNNNKVILKTDGMNKIENVFLSLYDKEIVKNLITKSVKRLNYSLEIHSVKPPISRSTKKHITIVVNNRYVKNSFLINNFIAGYDTYLDHKKYPIGYLSITIDPMLIDVNVHPNKTEIKLHNELEISEDIRNSVKEMLQQRTIIPDIKETDFKKTYLNNTVKEEYKPIVLDLETAVYSEKENEYLYEESLQVNKPISLNEEQKEDYKTDVEEEKQTNKLPYMEYVGIYQGTYLLFQSDKGLYLIDQHAANERINYEYYYNAFEKTTNASQVLLVPLSLELTKQEFLFIEENLDDFSKLGYKLEPSGIDSFFVREVPEFIKNKNIEQVTFDIMNYFIKNQTINLSEIRKNLAASVSCKKSVKANHHLSQNEISQLLKDLNKCDNPFNCPHGRPTIINISNYEIEKLFKRVV